MTEIADVEVIRHIEFISVFINKIQNIFDGRSRTFGDGHNVVFRQNFAVKFLQIFVQFRTFGVVLNKIAVVFGGQFFKR